MSSKKQVHREDPAIENEDWRLQAITTLAKDWVSPWTGYRHPKGTSVSVVTFVKFGKGELTFRLPNATALFLDFSWKLWEETQDFLENEENFAKTKSADFKTGTVYPRDKTTFFDIIEKRMGAAVFAYCALESFSNEQVPDNHVFEVEREDGRCTERYNKEQIEKFLKLEAKLDNLLPKLLNIKFPKDSQVWNNFKNLQNLRDRIVHMKTKDRQSSAASEKTIWGDLLDTKARNPACIALEIINHFLERQSNVLRWFGKFPYR